MTPELKTFLSRQISSPNVFEETVERLGAIIKMGLLGQGDKLPPERDLAKLIGISRTTVRNALHVLVAGNFLEVRRGRLGGTFVSTQIPKWNMQPSPEIGEKDLSNLSDLTDYRLVVEMGCVELAAERASPDQIENLLGIVADMPASENQLHSYRSTDVRFHLKIAEATQSARLVNIMANIHEQASEMMTLIPFVPEACRHSTRQHTEIAAAIERHDGATARAIMRRHVEATASFLRGLLPTSR